MKELIENKLAEAKKILEDGTGGYEYYMGKIDAYTYLLNEIESFD
jgi:hypothetical protein